MRISAISAPLLLALAGHSAAVEPVQLPSDAALEAALTSEFLFQSGDFDAAFDYYRTRAPTQLDAQALLRGRQIARVLGDGAWLQRTDALAANTETGIESLARRFEDAVRAGQARQAANYWRKLALTGPDGAGMLAARQAVAALSADHAAALQASLSVYACLPDLGQDERSALFAWALQWQMTALAAKLESGFIAGSAPSRLARLAMACDGAAGKACSAALQELSPDGLDENQRRLALALAERSADGVQVSRWLASLPQDSGTYYRRLLQLGQSADPQEAKRLQSQIAANASLNAFQRAALLGSLAEIGKDWPAAESHYRDVLATGKPSAAALRLPVVLMQQRQREAAYAQLRAVQDDPDYSDEIRREAFRMELQFDRALQADAATRDAVYRRALAHWPDAHALRYQYAMSLFESGRREQSLSQLHALIRQAPADADALNAYGYTLAKDLDRPKAAFKSIRTAYLLAPDQAEILDSYGYVLYRLGRSREALPLLQQAMRLTPSAVTAGHLAAVHLALGDTVQARQALNKGLQLDRSDAELLSLQERLR